MSSSESTSKNNEKKQTRKQQLAEAKTLLQKAKEQLATNNSDWKGTVEKAATELEKQWQFTPADLDKSKQVIDALCQEVDCVNKYYQDNNVSFISDEKVIASVDAGSALFGINLIDQDKFGSPGLSPLLAAPQSCPLLAPSLPSRMVTTKFTSVADVNNFTQTIRSAGLTIALNGNGIFTNIGGAVEGSNNSGAVSKQKNQTKKTSQLLYQLELHNIVKKAFRLGIDSVQLSTEAVNALNSVNNSSKAREFLCQFQSHINCGVQHLGGILICKTKIECGTEINIEMLEEASKLATSGSAGISFFGLFGIGASTTNVKVNTSKTDNESSLQYVHVSREIECFGPFCKMPDFFQLALDASNINWCIIDRGQFDSLVPVWKIIERWYPEDGHKLFAAQLLREAWLDMTSRTTLEPLVQAERNRVNSAKVRVPSILPSEESLPVRNEAEDIERNIIKLTGENFDPNSISSAEIRNTISKIDELITQRTYKTGLNLLPVVMKNEILPKILLKLATCEDQSKMNDVFSTIHKLFSPETINMFYQMQIEIPKEVMDFIRKSRPSTSRPEASEKNTSSETDNLNAVPLERLPARLENLMKTASTPSEQQLTDINESITKCLSRSLTNATSVEEANKLEDQLNTFGWRQASQRFSSILNVDQLHALISNIRQALSATTTETKNIPASSPSTPKQIQVPTGVFGDEPTLYHHNDWLVNRPMSEKLSPVSRFIDVLRHRTPLKSYSPLPADASLGTGVTSQGVSQKRLLQRGTPSKQQQTISSNTNDAPVGQNNDFNATYDVLIHLIQRSDLLGKMILYQLLIERRMAVPLLTPNLSSSGMPYSFHINALTFTSTKLSGENEVNMSLDVLLPRVAVISMRPIDKMESILWTSQLFSCRSAAYYAQKNIRCVGFQQCVAELGIGAFSRYTERKGDLIVDEKGERVEVLILNVIGNYESIFPFVVKFADILLVEETPDLDSHFKPPLELPKTCTIVAWKSDSQKTLSETIAEGWQRLTCTMKETIDEVRFFIQNILDDNKQLKTERSRDPLTNFQFPSLYHVHALDLLEIEPVVKDQNFTRLRKDVFQLQKLFADEVPYRKQLNENRSDLAKIGCARHQINELARQRQNLVGESANQKLIKHFLLILQQKDSRLRALSIYQIAQQLEKYSGLALRSLTQDLKNATDRFKMNQGNEERKGFYQTRNAYTSSVVRLEHLWREFSHIYTSNPGNYSHLADLAAQHLLDGFPLELLDGDAGLMNETWIKGVISRLDECIRRQNKISSVRIFVLSVLGVQSTGKSTLLNHMFGTRFRTSAGQCTRGVYIQLIKCENRVEYDYTLILDTEGMRAPEFVGSDSAWHDNRLASFSILPADATIILINNEEDTAVKEIIPIVLLVYQQSTLAANILARGRNKLVFVFMRNDQNDKKKLTDSKNALFLNLKKAATDIEKKHSEEELTTPLLHGFVCDPSSDGSSDIKSIGKLKKGDIPPDDVPDEEYGRAVVSLLEYIHSKLVTDPQNKWTARTLVSFIDYMSMVWQCIESADFTLSFKTVRDKWSHESLQNYCHSKRAELAVLYANAYNPIEGEILLKVKPANENATEACEKLIEEYQMKFTVATIEEAGKLRDDFLNGFQNRDDWKSWELETKSAWTQYCEEQRTQNQLRLKELITTRMLYDGVLVMYKQKLRAMITSEYEKKDKSQRKALLNSTEKQNAEFEKIFQVIIDEAEKTAPAVDVVGQVWKIYQDIGRDFNVKEKYMNEISTPKENQGNWNLFKMLYNRFTAEKHNTPDEGKQLSALIYKIENLLSTCTVYSNDIVIKCRDLTDTSINRKNKELWQRAHQTVYSVVVQQLSHIQNKWEQKNLTSKRLKTDKKEFWMHYIRTINGINGIEKFTYDLKDIFSKHWRKTFCGDICAYIANQRTDYLPWLTNSVIMMSYVNLQLLEWDENGNVDKLIEKVAQPAQHYKDRVNELLNDEITEIQQKRWTAYRNRLFKIIEDACTEVISHRDPDCATTEKDPSKVRRGRTGKYLFYIHSQLSSMGHFAKEFADDVEAIDPNESCDSEPDDKWTAMSDILKKVLPADKLPTNTSNICSSEACVICFDQFSIKEKQEMVQWIQKKLADTLSYEGAKPRCAEPCPQCSTPCSKQYLHQHKGDKLHDCEHQARGLVGTVWSKKSPNAGCLVYQSCNNLVAENCVFEIEDDKTIPYSDFSKYYPNWKQPDPLTTYGQETRQYIFAKYQKEIAEYHMKKPCVPIPQAFNHDRQTIQEMLRARIPTRPSDN